MDTSTLKRFAQQARINLQEHISLRINSVLARKSASRRDFPDLVNTLETRVEREGLSQVVEQIAHTWFIRFCALRFMDVNGYTDVKMVSSAEGQAEPDVLTNAKQGIISSYIPLDIKDRILGLLNGTPSSKDPDGEAYRLLLIASCNNWNKSIPLMFQPIADHTELLIPNNLLSQQSILRDVRNAMTAANCEHVEIMGWLHQFYISEKKKLIQDSKQRYSPETIPTATQLFTPHWIARYLIENSLGRLWMLNKPDSRLIEEMEYYIKPAESEIEFIKLSTPEEIKLCDPACGSGHLLTCAFDLLYRIYEEEGYTNSEIPDKILSHNIFGVDLDPDAEMLANFALIMKARSKYPSFFPNSITPNICILEKITFSAEEIHDYAHVIGTDFFNKHLKHGVNDFEQADHVGSLIQPKIQDVESIRKHLHKKNYSALSSICDTHHRIQKCLSQSEYLAQRYHIVVANPPYLGGKWMSSELSQFAKSNFPKSKSHMSSMFIERNLKLALPLAYSSNITMQSWMFLSSNEGVRTLILDHKTILSLVHFGPRAFDSIDGNVVSTVAFVLQNRHQAKHKGDYIRLIDGTSEAEKKSALKSIIKNPDHRQLYRISMANFNTIPGKTIAYWGTKAQFQIFAQNPQLSAFCEKRLGLCTGNNELFIRTWNEVQISSIGFSHNNLVSFHESNKLYAPHNKGGPALKWVGNQNMVIKFDPDHYEQLSNRCNKLASKSRYFQPSITWSELGSKFSVRLLPAGFVFNIKGPSIFIEDSKRKFLAGLLNSKVSTYLLKLVSSTISFNGGDIEKIPVIYSEKIKVRIDSIVDKIQIYSLSNYSSYETTWDFTSLPILSKKYHTATLQDAYTNLRKHWKTTTVEVQRLEEEINRIFIEEYGLANELTPYVPLAQITLVCNPHYRYSKGHKKTEKELDALLLCDTMKELISYSVGCMFGRYSIDRPGLILANQGETIEDFNTMVPSSRFEINPNNVLLISNEAWFTGDVVDRFKKFLKLTFSEEHYEQNLKFIENALNINNKKNYTIRDYFYKEFYKDHCRTYKKRPIYWLFSSSKGSFQALIYGHRYRKSTVSIVLNDYLKVLQKKLTAQKNHFDVLSNTSHISKSDKLRAIEEANSISSILVELDYYERDVLTPLSERNIVLDIDDGVKINCAKFGEALKKF